MRLALEIRTDLASPAPLRTLARRERSPRTATRMLAIADAMEGMSRAEAARLVVMERQAPRDAVVRYNAAGVEGLRNRPKPRRPPAQTEAERAVEGEALEPLSLPTAGSIRERRRYSALGKTAGGPWHCSDEGMIGQMPRQRAASQLAFVATLVDHHLPQRDVGADIEQDLELAAVAALPAHAVEIQRQAVEVPRYVDLGSLSAERRSTPPRERPSAWPSCPL